MKPGQAISGAGELLLNGQFMAPEADPEGCWKQSNIPPGSMSVKDPRGR